MKTIKTFLLAVILMTCNYVHANAYFCTNPTSAAADKVQITEIIPNIKNLITQTEAVVRFEKGGRTNTDNASAYMTGSYFTNESISSGVWQSVAFANNTTQPLQVCIYAFGYDVTVTTPATLVAPTDVYVCKAPVSASANKVQITRIDPAVKNIVSQTAVGVPFEKGSLANTASSSGYLFNYFTNNSIVDGLFVSVAFASDTTDPLQKCIYAHGYHLVP